MESTTGTREKLIKARLGKLALAEEYFATIEAPKKVHGPQDSSFFEPF